MASASRGLVVTVFAVFLVVEFSGAVTYSSRLIHRFSEEVKAFRVLRKGGGQVFGNWPERRSLKYYRMLASGDVQRQKMKLGPQSPFLFPSEGSKTMSFGNDFAWLHYTWIDIGMPSVSFLVAVDSGSDLLWVPCDCLQCAPLSASYYSSLDRDLHEYNPSSSSTSKNLSCSHQLCDLGRSCESPKQPCPYTVNYNTDNVSSSGLLVEDILHLVSGHANVATNSVRTPVVIGCGKKQSGAYLEGAAPDGLLGLGLGEVSVPSFLAKAGLVRNSFSLCFDEDGSGRIYFGDQGLSTQRTTPFLPLDGKYITYIIGADACCVGSSCLEQTSFKAQVDSGTSFTYFPKDIYESVVKEFDRRVKSTKTNFDGAPWQYCYEASSLELSKIPSLILKFALNNSFVVSNPILKVYDNQGLAGFCLALQPTDGDMGLIGQNFMTGYRMVFDRESHKLGWSSSNCQELGDGLRPPLPPATNGTFSNPLPTTEQQRTPGGHAVAPALAGRTPSKSSATTSSLIPCRLCFTRLLPIQLLMLHLLALPPILSVVC